MKNRDGKHPSKELTEIISRNIAGHEMEYDDWLQRFMISEREFPCYLGTTIITPGGKAVTFTIIAHNEPYVMLFIKENSVEFSYYIVKNTV